MSERSTMKAPFPAFGGKRLVTGLVWQRLGKPKHYIEPFCFSAAMLLAAPREAELEVIGDANGFVANFWRATKYQPEAVAEHADYPVSHVDLGARHRWLMEQRDRLADALQDPEWPGDPQVAGWWLWGQCCWIGSGWCDWFKVTNAGVGVQALGQVPHVSDAGMGVQALGQVPHVSNAGRGVQALGKVPHVSNAGRGVQALGKVPHVSDAGRGYLTSGGAAAHVALTKLAARLGRVRVVHGNWDRCLNSHYGGKKTAVFLDPPYCGYEKLYGDSAPVADEVASWARDNAGLRVAICGHVGDYDLPGWDAVQWSRGASTYAGKETTDLECIWFSPACIKPEPARQVDMFEMLKEPA